MAKIFVDSNFYDNYSHFDLTGAIYRKVLLTKCGRFSTKKWQREKEESADTKQEHDFVERKYL